MKKTITRDELIAYLSGYESRCEIEDGKAVYYVHIGEGGNLVDSKDDAETTVTATLCDISDFPADSTMEVVYDKESEDDPDFSRMVDELMVSVQQALDELE